MTIKDAIVEQQNYLNHSDQWSHERLDEAVGLGIEALRFVQRYRPFVYPEVKKQLPGETKE